MVAVYRRPNLFRLYSEILPAISENITLEDQVTQHLQNSNYGHAGNSLSAEIYEWHNYASLLSDRFQHDMLHAFLAILCEVEGWDPFFADGNHRAEALTIHIEPIFRFWDQGYNSTLEKNDGNYFKKKALKYYGDNLHRDQRTFMAGWIAASKSERAMTAFEARFLGILPGCSVRETAYEQGLKNKWGETISAFNFDGSRIDLFYNKMILVRQRMMETLEQSPFDHRNKEVCQEFFKTLRVGDVAKIISGENPDQELSYDAERLKKAQLASLDPAELSI